MKPQFVELEYEPSVTAKLKQFPTDNSPHTGADDTGVDDEARNTVPLRPDAVNTPATIENVPATFVKPNVFEPDTNVADEFSSVSTQSDEPFSLIEPVMFR